MRDHLRMWVRDSDGGQVWIDQFGRDEFLAERWVYRPGEHITILAPTDYGKTTFTGELLRYTIRPDLPVLRFGLKPRDHVLAEQNKTLGVRTVRDWPPAIVGHPPGWTLWPKHTDDPDTDDYRLAEIILNALRWSYRN